MMFLVTGNNLFGQWFSEESIFTEFNEISIGHKIPQILIGPTIIEVNWSYTLFQTDYGFYLAGSWRGVENNIIKIPLPEEFSKEDFSNLLLSGNDYKLFLINTAKYILWILDIERNEYKKINFAIESPVAKDIKKKRNVDKIVKIVSTNTSNLYLTEEGLVYSGMLPSLVEVCHCNGKIVDVQCGYEHFVLLSDTGTVYTWGNGRRLQLGHGDLSNIEVPTEVDALSGIKIVKICAGGWHTLALSESGDLYCWGWNDTGQLGIKEKESKGSYLLPTLVDIFNENGDEMQFNVIDMGCGSRHSVLILEDGSVWSTGCNKYGQLGFSPELYPELKQYKKTHQCKNKMLLNCGLWSTVLVNM